MPACIVWRTGAERLVRCPLRCRDNKISISCYCRKDTQSKRPKPFAEPVLKIEVIKGNPEHSGLPDVFSVMFM